MCGRFAILRQLEEIARLFEARIGFDRLDIPNYNVAPTNEIPSVINHDGRELVALRWGLIPAWAGKRDNPPQPINARAETVATNGMFRSAFRSRRCLVPADGFYEWSGPKGNRQPHFIRRKDGAPLAMAGIWEEARLSDDDVVRSCAIITTDANSVIAELHNRMPVILETDAWDVWLDPETADTDELQSLLAPAEDSVLEHYPVSPDVNNVRNNRPDLVEPMEQKKLM